MSARSDTSRSPNGPGNPGGHDVKPLTGIRGAAILLVLTYHLGNFIPSGAVEKVIDHATRLGWAGVDLFFCLSGFLITRILLPTSGSPGYYRSFYARRILRIIPLYCFFLVCLAAYSLLPAVTPPIRRDLQSNLLWAGLFVSNWRSSNSPFTSHLWSLGVEEQFYLTWPILVAVFRKRTLSFCLILATVSLLFRIAGCYYFHVPAVFIYRATPFRLDSLAMGGAAACISLQPALFRKIKALLPFAIMGGFAVVAAVTVKAGAGHSSRPMMTVGFAALALSFSAVVLACSAGSGLPVKLLSAAPLVQFGKYSYAIYLFHYMLAGPTTQGFRYATGRCLVSIALSYAAAWLSWRVLEQPFLRLKRFFEYDRESLTAATGRL